MQNGNKQPHWKEKLGDANLLASEATLNTEVSWEALQHRLQNRTNRRKALLYWVSAACLLPLFLLVSFFYYTNYSNIIKRVAQVHIPAKPSPEKSEPVHNETIIAKLVAPSVKKNIHQEKSQKNALIVITKGKSSSIKSNDSVSLRNEVVFLTSSDSSSIKTTVLAPPKQKLKVVHINELSDPQEATPVMARIYFPRSFPLHIATIEMETAPVQMIHTTSFINLKTKRSSN